MNELSAIKKLQEIYEIMKDAEEKIQDSGSEYGKRCAKIAAYEELERLLIKT